MADNLMETKTCRPVDITPADFCFLFRSCEMRPVIEGSTMALDADGSPRLAFRSFTPQTQKRVNELVQKYHITSVVSFNMAREACGVRMPVEELKEESSERLLTQLEAIFPKEMADGREIEKVCGFLSGQIKACLANVCFSKEFWCEEKTKANEYATRIATSPIIMETVRHWNEQMGVSEKQKVISEAAQIFEKVYGCAPKIAYYTEAEKRAEYAQKGFSNVHINSAYSEDDTIYFNADRLKTCDNFFVLSVLLHEGTHFRQKRSDEAKIKDSVARRLFTGKANVVNHYDRVLENKGEVTPEHEAYMDLSAMRPTEVHAYGIQSHFETIFAEVTGLQKTENQLPKAAQIIHEKSFAWAQAMEAFSRGEAPKYSRVLERMTPFLSADKLKLVEESKRHQATQSMVSRAVTGNGGR